MALKSTIFRVELEIQDYDREVYAAHQLTIARHPSETDERMMVRLLAYALNASESLAFGRGLESSDEPDVWLKDLTGAITLWIEVGLPDTKRVRRFAGRASRVALYAFGRAAEPWWKQNEEALQRLQNLAVFKFDPSDSIALAALVQRTMSLRCAIQDGEVTVSGADREVRLVCHQLKPWAPTAPVARG